MVNTETACNSFCVAKLLLTCSPACWSTSILTEHKPPGSSGRSKTVQLFVVNKAGHCDIQLDALFARNVDPHILQPVSNACLAFQSPLNPMAINAWDRLGGGLS